MGLPRRILSSRLDIHSAGFEGTNATLCKTWHGVSIWKKGNFLAPFKNLDHVEPNKIKRERLDIQISNHQAYKRKNHVGPYQ
jgi:hypothetical protein